MAVADSLQPGPRLVVGRIDLVTRDIFSAEEVRRARPLVGVLRRMMNGLHVKTRRWVLQRELLFAPGDPFDPAALAETERTLRSLAFLNDVSVAPVDTSADGRVRILVSARESWSLQTTFNYSRAADGGQRWNVALSDRNFLGTGATLGAGLGEDEINPYWDLWFSKRRVFGSDFVLGAELARPTDGHRNVLTVSRPFYAEDDGWGLDLLAWDQLGDARHFLSNGGPVGLDPAREASLYAQFPRHEKGWEARAQVRVAGAGGGRIWRLGGGVRVTTSYCELEDRPVQWLSDGRWADLTPLLARGEPLARIRGRSVHAFVWVRSLGRRWTKGRFIQHYGPVEDLPLDWSAELKLGPNGSQLGSTTAFGGPSWRAEAGAFKWGELGPGLLMLQAWAEAETGTPETANHRLDLLAGWYCRRGDERRPWLTRVTVEVAGGEGLAGNQALVLGLERGVRTLDFDGMAGDRLVRWNLEQGKAAPGELLGFFRWGAALFYSGGAAWWRDEERGLADARHEAGIGLRIAPTRSANSQTTRLDLTWDLDGDGGPVFTAITRGSF